MDKKRDSFFLANKKKDKQPDRNADKEVNKGMKKDRGDQQGKKKRQDHFMKNRVSPENGQDKKPFDKKAYRLKKYSKKYKLDQWEEHRKKQLLRNYYKEVKNEPATGSYKPINFDEDVTDSNQEVGRFVKHPDVLEKEKASRKDPFWQAKQQYNKIKQDKQRKKEEIEKAKEEKNQKLQEYKKKKQERFKKLSKKTKKGQPVMTGRLEMLLEKIQTTK